MKLTGVNELAKELGVSSADVVSAAKDIGVNLSMYPSSVDTETAEKIRKVFSSVPGAENSGGGVKVVEFGSGDKKITETRTSGRVVRRRIKVEKPAEQKPEEVELPEKRTAAQAAWSAPDGVPAKEPEKKSVKEKPAVQDPEKEKLARKIEGALAPKLTARKKEYIVDEKSFRRKQEIRRRKPPQPQTSSPAPKPAQSQPPGRKNVKIGESITLEDLARRMEMKLKDVRAKARSIGIESFSKKQLDYETAILIAAEYGLDVEVDRFDESAYLNDSEAGLANEAPRPPVVSIMGHVDHGKTTLLDTLRKSNVASGEAGGITQRIGAYKVASGERQVVFIDTPGHESFTSMRARGAMINDMVILVVAADDGVKAQTIEAISHAGAAGVPVIVAVNKIDKDGADPENVKRQLSEHGLVAEDWGGDTLFVEISAKTGQGLKELLEIILLQADILELRAPQTGIARGIVLESRLDKGRGAIADVIIKKGGLKVGDHVIAGIFTGRVRSLSDENGVKLKTAGPSMPVEIMGLSGVPDAGENFYVVRDEKTARSIADNRRLKIGQSEAAAAQTPSLDAIEMMRESQENAPKELSLIIKGDTRGSIEAIRDSIGKIESEKCTVKIAHSGVGGITGNDVDLAHVTNSSILGFNVRPDPKAASEASRRGILIETHSIVYEILERIKQIMEGLLDPLVEEETVGNARVLEIFRVSGQRAVAGCIVDEGKVLRGGSVRIVRDGAVVYESKIGSLKRFKDDVREVQSGYECGLTVENFSDVKVGDVLEIYSVKETAQQL